MWNLWDKYESIELTSRGLGESSEEVHPKIQK